MERMESKREQQHRFLFENKMFLMRAQSFHEPNRSYLRSYLPTTSITVLCKMSSYIGSSQSFNNVKVKTKKTTLCTDEISYLST